ncbi:MAG: hypothetical protein IH948_06725 [Bacteroidetes bacterium]|nr:hypothetical protein [Bacteroidota bacterium]
MRIKIFIVFAIIMALFSHCKKDEIVTEEAISSLSFSLDTVLFDTVFTTIGTITKNFRIYNNSKYTISISSISLKSGITSDFRINVDGIAGQVIEDLEIAGNDSAFVFVEATIDPTGFNQPLIVSDSIVFASGTEKSYVGLVAWGQDAYYYTPNFSLPGYPPMYLFPDNNNFLGGDKPHVFYGYAVVDSANKLIIGKGARLHFISGTGLWIYKDGTLIVNGDEANPVYFLGDRLDSDYDEIPGQWEGILIHDGVDDNSINYAVIKNAFVGIQIEPGYSSDPNTISSNSVLIKNTIIANMVSAGIVALNSKITAFNLLVTNCGLTSLSILGGGNYSFTHCSFVDYWDYDIRNTPSIFLSNTYSDGLGTTYNNDLDSAYFGNCIIHGTLDDEITFENNGTNTFLPYFDGCIVNESDVSNGTIFNNIINNPVDVIVNGSAHHPIYTDYNTYDYSIFETSVVRDKGDVTIGLTIPLDLNRNSRTSDVAPDIGATEYIP